MKSKDFCSDGQATQGIYELVFKRIIDITVSGLALVILSPVLAVVSIFVRINLGSPVLFVQERPGKNEKIFRLYKFRTMKDITDEDGNQLPDGERMTRFGSFLRSASIDELPELFNILKGDMSLVGPRPLLVRYLPRYNERQHHRHDVRPGLTGYAQVNGRNHLSWEEKFEMDLWYVDHVSFLTDFRIFMKTIASVVKREGINSETSATMEEFYNKEDKENE